MSIAPRSTKQKLSDARKLAARGATLEALRMATEALRGLDRIPGSLEDRLAARGDLAEAKPGDLALLAAVLAAAEPSRRFDWLAQGLASLLLIGYLGVKLAPPFGLHATASAEFDAAHGAQNALDGREASEWLLPNKTAGWLELGVSARAVRTLRVLNATNRPGPDRAVIDWTVEVYDGETLKKSINGTFGPFRPRPEWHLIALDTARATRVRFLVRSWAGKGGGLAEVVLD